MEIRVSLSRHKEPQLRGWLHFSNFSKKKITNILNNRRFEKLSEMRLMIYIDNIYEPDEISCQHYEANKFTLQACNGDEIESLFPHFEFRDTKYIVCDQFWNPRGYAFGFTEKLEGILAKLWQSSIGLTLSYLTTFPRGNTLHYKPGWLHIL